MNKKVLIVLLLIPGMARAVICKTVDAEGIVSYTDVPAAECKKPVRLPPSSTYQPRSLPVAPPGPEASAQQPADKPFERYESIQIVQPEANGTVRSNEGKVNVVVALEPALQTGHRIKVYVDGAAIPGEFDGPSIELTGVVRGTHSLRVVVSDATGRRQGDSPSVRFTLRQAGLFDTALPETPENPVEPPPVEPGYPAPGDKPDFGPADKPDFDPADKADYGPGSVPDYSPGQAPAASTPGQTNPAFKPNFKP